MRTIRVLMVDDSPLFLSTARQLLAGEPGIEIVGAVHSGQQALEQVSALHPDLVVMDLCMPEMDGYEVAKIIKQKFRPGEPLVVALTANTDKGTKERCLQIGMDDVVLKPISLQEMSTVLCKLLKSGSRSQGNSYLNGR